MVEKPGLKDARICPTCGREEEHLFICPKCGIVGCKGDGTNACRYTADYIPHCLQCGLPGKPFTWRP